MTKNDNFDDLAELLPFYVNGTLAASECAKIDGELAASPRLRDELEVLGGLAQLVKAGGTEMTRQTPESKAQGETRLETVLGKLEDKPLPHEAPVLPKAPAQELGALLGFLNPKRWHPAVSLALAAAVVGQGVTIANLNQGKAENASQIASLQKRVGDLEFQLASGPDGDRKGSLMLALKAGTTWSEVETLLGAEGLTILGGPSDGTLILSSEAKGAVLDAQIDRLRKSPLVASADKAA